MPFRVLDVDLAQASAEEPHGGSLAARGYLPLSLGRQSLEAKISAASHAKREVKLGEDKVPKFKFRIEDSGKYKF
jgi:hypothetical protein